MAKNFGTRVTAFTASLILAFLLFMGMSVVRGVFNDPAVAPTGGNTEAPLHVGAGTQTKSGSLILQNMFINAAPFNGAPVSTFIQIAEIERYTVSIDRSLANHTLPLDMVRIRSLCEDSDGCRIWLGMRNWAPANVPPQPGDRPQLTASRGPFQFFMSPYPGPQAAHVGWWRTSPQGVDNTSFIIGTFVDPPLKPAECQNRPPGPGDLACIYTGPVSPGPQGTPAWLLRTAYHGAEGRDNNGFPETILRAWDCYFVDGEYTPAGSDTISQFGLLNYSGGGAGQILASRYPVSPVTCTLEIED